MELFANLFATDLTPPEVLETEVRYLLMYASAYSDRAKREEAHVLGLRNDIRSWLGADPITPDESSPSTSQDTESLDAFKYRVTEKGIMDWDRDLTQ